MQTLLNGLLGGLPLALLALAFALVYAPLRILHVAMGGLYTIAPFIAWQLLGMRWSWSLAAGLAIVVVAVLSLLIEAANHGPLRAKGASAGVHMVSSLGLFIVLTHLTALVWGNDVRALRSGVARTFSFGAISVSEPQLVGGMFAGVLLLVFFIGWRWTGLGLRLRALMSNDMELALRGHNTERLRLLCFVISGALCACSSLLIAYDTGFGPDSGLSALVLAILATIIGGRYSLNGAALGGLLIGVLRAETSWHFSGRWREASTLLLLVALLLIWPRGLTIWRPRGRMPQ